MDYERDGDLAAALGERLCAHGLLRVVDDLLRLAQPAIRLDLTRVDDEASLPLGASKVGGEPDLPTGTSWPTSNNGAPLPFIAQIRLADIAPFDPENDLPHDGLLSFFYAMNEPSGELRIERDMSAWRVVWSREGASLFRLPTPDALTNALDSRFPACAVAYARRLTLPGPEAPAIQRLGFTNDERLGYIDVALGSDMGYLPEMDLHLLGYPYQLEPDPFISAYRAAHSIREPFSNLSRSERVWALDALGRLRNRIAHLSGRWHGERPSEDEQQRVWEAAWKQLDLDDQRRILSAAVPLPLTDTASRAMTEQVETEWRLLLQIYSNEQAEMDWAGGGVIHFGVKREALAARDFSQVWVSLQSL